VPEVRFLNLGLGVAVPACFLLVRTPGAAPLAFEGAAFDFLPLPTSAPPGMRLPLHHAEMPVITDIRPMRPAPPLRRHPIHRTSLRIQRLPTLRSENDESHKKKDHRKQNNSERLLASRRLLLRSYPSDRQNPRACPEKVREAQARATPLYLQRSATSCIPNRKHSSPPTRSNPPAPPSPLLPNQVR
jgi:hypothetical protein